MAGSDSDEKPPPNYRRLGLALVGLVVGLIIINGGLNMLSHAGDDQPTVPTVTTLRVTGGSGSTSQTSPPGAGTSPASSTTPGTAASTVTTAFGLS